MQALWTTFVHSFPGHFWPCLTWNPIEFLWGTKLDKMIFELTYRVLIGVSAEHIPKLLGVGFLALTSSKFRSSTRYTGNSLPLAAYWKPLSRHCSLPYHPFARMKTFRSQAIEYRWVMSATQISELKTIKKHTFIAPSILSPKDWRILSDMMNYLFDRSWEFLWL